MTDKPIIGPTHTARIALKVEPEWREKVFRAAKTQDGDNISRLVRRAVDELIERENLLPDTEPQELAS